MTEVVATNQTILVVGGGISGMTAAIEAADLLAVRAFRSHILESRLLGWSEARSWLADRLEERDAWKRIHLPYVFLRSSCARANPWEAKTAVAAYEAGLQLEGFNHADSELDYLYSSSSSFASKSCKLKA